MLAPISNDRRDRGTSFRKLCKYLTTERDPKTGEDKPRGEILLSDNVLSLATAPLEMRGIAAHNPLCKDPVYHYQIAWPPGEQPSQQQWEAAAVKTLADLGFSERQYLIVAHHDRDHFHIHIMVNKVHPESYRAHTPYRDVYTLDKAMRELEHAQGWSEGVGTYRWDKEAGSAIKNTRAEREALSRRRDSPSRKAAELEVFRGGQSLQTYAKGKPAADLQMLLARHTVSWVDVHNMLYSHGLEIHRADHGRYTVHAIDAEIVVKASDVFRRAFSGKANRETIEAKLGPWQAAPEIRDQTDSPGRYRSRPPEASAERQRRREQREEARLALKRKFGVYRSACREQQKEHTKIVRERRAELQVALAREKHEIRARKISWPEKRAALSCAVAENAIRARLLGTEAARERLALTPKRYESWVMEQAEKGNEAAVAQLRGWRFRDRRLVRQADAQLAVSQNVVHLSAGRAGEADDWSEPIPGGRIRDLQRSERLAQELQRIAWRVDRRTGNIQYLIDGKMMVADRGKALSVFSADETALVFALEVAVRKYGRCIEASGSEEWRQKVARVAARHGLAVEFTDEGMHQAMMAEKILARTEEPGYQDFLARFGHEFRRRTSKQAQEYVAEVVPGLRSVGNTRDANLLERYGPAEAQQIVRTTTQRLGATKVLLAREQTRTKLGLEPRGNSRE